MLNFAFLCEFVFYLYMGEPIFMSHGQYLNRNASPIQMRSTNLPFFRIDKKELLNIYIPNVPIIKEYKLNFTTDPIFSQSNIKSIYSMGINFLRNK